MKTQGTSDGGPPAAWALTGPTGTGKSALGCALAERIGGEVIGCDSVQLYRGFDVASAKPSAAERARVPHHLVDCRAPDDPMDAHAFCAAARGVVAAIRGRGRVPLFVGGTGLYLRALQHGLIAVPSEPALRARLAAEVAKDPRAAHARLATLDPVGAATLHPHNTAHLTRALEVCTLTGRPASEVRAAHAAQRAGPDALPLVVVALDGPDAWLRQRLCDRSAAMVRADLLAEVRGLLACGVPRGCPAMRAVGYREALAVLDGALAEAQLAPAIAAASWRYVRRQRTWLRRERPAATLDAWAAQGGRALETLTQAALWAFRRAAAAAPAARAGPTD